HTRWPRDWSSDVCSSDLFGSYGSEPTGPAAGSEPGQCAPTERGGDARRHPGAVWRRSGGGESAKGQMTKPIPGLWRSFRCERERKAATRLGLLNCSIAERENSDGRARV